MVRFACLVARSNTVFSIESPRRHADGEHVCRVNLGGRYHEILGVDPLDCLENATRLIRAFLIAKGVDPARVDWTSP